MLRNTMKEPPACRQGSIFGNGQTGGEDVDTAISTIKIVPAAMMPRMLTQPTRKWGERDKAAHPADSLVRFRENKNELWPQSCWIAKIRTTRPSAGKASATTTQ